MDNKTKSSRQNIRWAVDVSANYRYVQGWHTHIHTIIFPAEDVEETGTTANYGHFSLKGETVSRRHCGSHKLFKPNCERFCSSTRPECRKIRKIRFNFNAPSKYLIWRREGLKRRQRASYQQEGEVFFSFLAEFFEGVWKIQNERWCRSASDKCVDKQLRVFTSARTTKSTSDNLQPNVKQIFVGWRWRRNEGLGTSFVFCFVFFPGRFQKTFHKNSKAYNTFLDKSAISCVQCAQKNSSENNLR